MDPERSEPSASGRAFEVTVLDRPLTRLAGWFLLPGFLALLIAQGAEDPTVHPTLLCVGFGTTFLFGALVLWAQTEETPRRIVLEARASPQGLVASGKQWVEPARIKNAFVKPEERGAIVTMRGRFRSPTMWVPSVAEGEALLDALGLTAASRASTFPLGTSLLMPVVIAMLVGLPAAVVFRHSPFLTRALPALLPGLVPLALLWRRTVTIASDGVSIDAGAVSQFVPYAEITRVQNTGQTILLHRVQGKWARIEVRTGGYGQGKGSGVEVVAAAIEKAMAAWSARAATRPERPFEPVAGQGGPGAVHYRVASVPRERLIELVEDPTADVRIRVAAAESLRGDVDDETRARLDRVAATSAAPDLRRALGPRPGR